MNRVKDMTFFSIIHEILKNFQREAVYKGSIKWCDHLNSNTTIGHMNNVRVFNAREELVKSSLMIWDIYKLRIGGRHIN